MFQGISPNKKSQLISGKRRLPVVIIIVSIIAILLFLYNCLSFTLIFPFDIRDFYGPGYPVALILILSLSIINALLFLPLLKYRKKLALSGIILAISLPLILFILYPHYYSVVQSIKILILEKKYPITQFNQIISSEKKTLGEKLEIPAGSILIGIDETYKILTKDGELQLLAGTEQLGGETSGLDRFVFSENKNYFAVTYYLRNEIWIYKIDSDLYWQIKSSTKHRKIKAVKFTSDEKTLIYTVGSVVVDGTSTSLHPSYGILDLDSCQSKYYESAYETKLDVSVSRGPNYTSHLGSLEIDNKIYRARDYYTDSGIAPIIEVYDSLTGKTEVFFDPRMMGLGEGSIYQFGITKNGEMISSFYKGNIYFLSQDKKLKKISNTKEFRIIECF